MEQVKEEKYMENLVSSFKQFTAMDKRTEESTRYAN